MECDPLGLSNLAQQGGLRHHISFYKQLIVCIDNDVDTRASPAEHKLNINK